MNWPSLTVLLVTYDRPKEIRKTIDALKDRIDYPGKLRWHIADDSSPGNYLPALFVDYPELRFTATATNRKGWGANVNKALGYIKTDYVFLCEDDYVAQRPLNLRDGVSILGAVPELGLIRYDGLAGHIGLRLWLKEAKANGKTINYLQLDRKHSGHLNVYSNRPHLRHRRLLYAVGPYAEGHRLGMTEEAYALRIIDTDPGCELAILADGIPRAFLHIGKSRQGTELDRPQ